MPDSPDLDRNALARLRELADTGRERAHGLPPAQVRALGARRHRHRTLAVTAAASVAVAVFAGGALAVTGQLTETTAPSGPVDRPGGIEPVDRWLTEIPAGVRVDRGLATDDADVNVTGPAEGAEVPAYEVCDAIAYPPAHEPTDRLAVLAQGPEYRATRVLTVYRDAETAQDALREFVTAVEDCPREELEGGAWRRRAVVESGVGEEGYVVVQGYGQRGLGPVLGTYSSQLARVGNALVFVEELGEGAPGSQAELGLQTRVRRTAAAISTDMCVFSAARCGADGTGAGDGEALTPSALLREDQATYHRRGDFRVVATVHGEGEGHVSVCQRSPLSSLGAVDVWRRDFTFRQGPDGPALRTAVLQFPDRESAEDGYATLGTWAEDCAEAVRSRGFDRVSPRGRWIEVSAGDGMAGVRIGMTYGPVPGDRFGDLQYFDDQGVALVGDRVALVTMVTAGQDANWAFERGDPTGLPVHPMLRMLPQAAANLAD